MTSVISNKPVLLALSRKLLLMMGGAGLALVFSGAVAFDADAKTRSKKLSYEQMRQVVMSAPRGKLRTIGAHIIVGYDQAWQLTPYLERGAIGGIYLTKRNARRRSSKQIAREVAQFRKIVAGRSARPLWITAD